MKRVMPLFLCMAIFAVLLVPIAVQAEAEIAADCKAAYVCDWQSGTEAYAKDAEKRLPIASMCKIMTLLLCFDAADSGSLSYDEEICVSENASGMGGSQVFLETSGRYTAGELIKSICIASANDSCVAMAERICGSEDLFVKAMNERARSLGMENTIFSNCTGLPKPGQYSCAKDVAKMLSALLRHEKYFEYSRIWMDEIEHPGGRKTEMANTNKLIRSYSGCDAGKTGYTAEAGFCLAASAKRGDMRIVSVVIGGNDSNARFMGVRKLFDYTFANFESRCLLDGDVLDDTVSPVSGGKQKQVPLKPERPIYLFCRKGSQENISLDINAEELRAPVSVGEKAGNVTIYRDGVEVQSVPLLANASVEKMNYFDCIQDIAENWIF